MISFKKFIQVAGVIDIAEAEMLLKNGVKYIGFPLRLDYHKEDLSEEEAAGIIKFLQPEAHAVLITYEKEAARLNQMVKSLGVKILQIHGEITVAELSKLKDLNPETILLKSLVVGTINKTKLKAIINDSSEFIDAYITDSFDPLTGARGATGKTHDWSVSRELVEYSPKPVILAGGLNPSNVSEAISEVKPAGVDVHTGVEDSTGRKCEKLIIEFVNNAMKALERIN